MYRVDGRRVLSHVQYVILPIYWDEELNDSDYDMDLSTINATLIANAEYYSDMSWGLMTVEHEILQQHSNFSFSKANPDMSKTAARAREIVKDEYGYELHTDYDAIGLAYHKANSGNLANGGGWASVNGGFMWNTYGTVSCYFTLHLLQLLYLLSHHITSHAK